MADSEARGDAGRYFSLLGELRDFRAARLGGQPADRALGRAAGVKPDTIKAWLVNGQFPQDAAKFAAVVRAIAAEARARGIVPEVRQADALDNECWREVHRDEARRRAGDVSAGAVRGQAARALAGAPAGRLLAEVTDPFALEVHRAVQPGAPHPGLPELPAYVARDHDMELERVVAAAAEGRSGVAVLVGGSSTGKTRACWETLRHLRDQPKPWRLWHPIDPTRPEAALHGLSSVGARTVVWLNETQFYLDVAASGLGERVAAGLRELLRDPDRAPVLVLATLWPEYWGGLTSRPTAGTDDPHAQARELLAGRDIPVPAAFTAGQLPLLTAAGDPRLSAAAEAEGGRAVQFLAGAPELIARYANAPPGAAALISAAMDARRLGMGVALPLAFLEAAVPGYLTDTEWDSLPEDWLEQALSYTAAPCKGTRGPLSRIRPRTASTAAASPGTAYRLADYLEQHCRQARREHVPPDSFWAAALSYADDQELSPLAGSAEARGLYWYAALLYVTVAPRDAGAACDLLDLIEKTGDPGVASAARWLSGHAGLADVFGLCRLLDSLHLMKLHDAVAELARRAQDADLHDPDRASDLLDTLVKCGAMEAARAVAVRAAAEASANFQFELMMSVRRTGSQGAIDTLAEKAARQADLTDAFTAANLLAEASAARGDAAVRLAGRAAAETRLADLDDMALLASVMHKFGLRHALSVLASRLAGANVAAAMSGHANGLAKLIQTLRGTDAAATAAALARQVAAAADEADPRSAETALDILAKAQAEDELAALAMRTAARAVLGDGHAVADLVDCLSQVQAHGALVRLADRIPSKETSIRDSLAVVTLMSALQRAGADGAVARLVDLHPEEHARIQDSGAVASLLSALQDAGASGAVSRLLNLDPAEYADPGDYRNVTRLARALRGAGDATAADRLIERAAAQIDVTDTETVTRWLTWLPSEMRFDPAITDALLKRDPGAYARLSDPGMTAQLLLALAHRGSPAAISSLLERDDFIRSTDPGCPGGIATLLRALRRIGADSSAESLLGALDLASCAAVAPPNEVLDLLCALHETGATQAADALLSRYPLDRVDLSDPDAVVRHLNGLSEIGATGTITALLELNPADKVALDRLRVYTFDPQSPLARQDVVYAVHQALSRAGACGPREAAASQASRLLSRAADAAMFYSVPGHDERFQFGREPDGRPSSRWQWEDLLTRPEVLRRIG